MSSRVSTHIKTIARLMPPLILLPLVACTGLRQPAEPPIPPEMMIFEATRMGESAFEDTQPIAPKAVDDLRVHFLNVGAGGCQVIECPGEDAGPILYDCGSIALPPSLSMSDDEAAAYVQQVLDLYDEEPIVVISHPHTDHYDILPDIVEIGAARSIWFGGRRTKFSSSFEDWLDDQEDAGVPIFGDVGSFPPRLPSGFHNDGEAIPGLQCGDAESFILTVNEGSNPNARSLVLRIVYDEFVLTLSGDAEGETEEGAIDNYPAGALRTTVLTASHHGSESHDSNGEEWADATRPQVTIFNSGVNFHHPRCSSINVYREHLATVNPHPTWCGTRSGSTKYHTAARATNRAEYVVALSGVITVVSDGEGFDLRCSLVPECGL